MLLSWQKMGKFEGYTLGRLGGRKDFDGRIKPHRSEKLRQWDCAKALSKAMKEEGVGAEYVCLADYTVQGILVDLSGKMNTV